MASLLCKIIPGTTQDSHLEHATRFIRLYSNSILVCVANREKLKNIKINFPFGLL